MTDIIAIDHALARELYDGTIGGAVPPWERPTTPAIMAALATAFELGAISMAQTPEWTAAFLHLQAQQSGHGPTGSGVQWARAFAASHPISVEAVAP